MSLSSNNVCFNCENLTDSVSCKKGMWPNFAKAFKSRRIQAITGVHWAYRIFGKRDRDSSFGYDSDSPRDRGAMYYKEIY